MGTAAQEMPGLPEREELRRAHKVRLVTEEEDGTGVDRLPDGVYGFTYSAGTHDAPLFQKSGYHAFEIHKDPGGEVWLIGWVSEGDARMIRESEGGTVHLRPAPQDSATISAALPMSRVARVKEHSAHVTGALEVWLGPA